MASQLAKVAAVVGVLVLVLPGCSAEPPQPTAPRVAPTSVTATTAAPPSATPRNRPSSPEPATASPEPSVPPTPQDVVTGLNAPWSVVFLQGVALVSERDSGAILELSDDGVAREVGVVEGVAPRGEGGLLGLAVDDQGRLYAYFTAAKDNRIVRYDMTGEPGRFALGNSEVILEGVRKSSTHNGGRIAFGPDGMLYVTTGDANDPKGPQNKESLSGKILRMTPDGDVPQDNPFGSLIWTWGHRNVQGIAWTTDGTMFATEFGQKTWDELNIIEAGNNYGWPVEEGIANNDKFVDPVQQWPPKEASPSGMAYLDGTLYIANLKGQRLRTVEAANPTTASEFFSREYGRLRHVAVAPDGMLWVITNNTDGRGKPRDGDDRILAVPPEALAG